MTDYVKKIVYDTVVYDKIESDNSTEPEWLTNWLTDESDNESTNAANILLEMNNSNIPYIKDTKIPSNKQTRYNLRPRIR